MFKPRYHSEDEPARPHTFKEVLAIGAIPVLVLAGIIEYSLYTIDVELQQYVNALAIEVLSFGAIDAQTDSAQSHLVAAPHETENDLPLKANMLVTVPREAVLGSTGECADLLQQPTFSGVTDEHGKLHNQTCTVTLHW